MDDVIGGDNAMNHLTSVVWICSFGDHISIHASAYVWIIIYMESTGSSNRQSWNQCLQTTQEKQCADEDQLESDNTVIQGFIHKDDTVLLV